MSSAKCGTDTKGKQDYEKEFSTLHRIGIVHLRVHDAHGGLHLPTIGRSAPLSAYRLWRDTHFQRQLDRDRLQVPLSRVMSPERGSVPAGGDVGYAEVKHAMRG